LPRLCITQHSPGASLRWSSAVGTSEPRTRLDRPGPRPLRHQTFRDANPRHRDDDGRVSCVRERPTGDNSFPARQVVILFPRVGCRSESARSCCRGIGRGKPHNRLYIAHVFFSTCVTLPALTNTLGAHHILWVEHSNVRKVLRCLLRGWWLHLPAPLKHRRRARAGPGAALFVCVSCWPLRPLLPPLPPLPPLPRFTGFRSMC